MLIFRQFARPQIVADGNFKLQHMKMKKPEDDVWLRDGGGFMVQNSPYQTHLKTTKEESYVSGSWYIMTAFIHFIPTHSGPAVQITRQLIMRMPAVATWRARGLADARVPATVQLCHILLSTFRREKGR